MKWVIRRERKKTTGHKAFVPSVTPQNDPALADDFNLPLENQTLNPFDDYGDLEAELMTPSNDELQSMARSNPPPKWWRNQGEDCPF